MHIVSQMPFDVSSVSLVVDKQGSHQHKTDHRCQLCLLIGRILVSTHAHLLELDGCNAWCSWPLMSLVVDLRLGLNVTNVANTSGPLEEALRCERENATFHFVCPPAVMMS